LPEISEQWHQGFVDDHNQQREATMVAAANLPDHMQVRGGELAWRLVQTHRLETNSAMLTKSMSSRARLSLRGDSTAFFCLPDLGYNTSHSAFTVERVSCPCAASTSRFPSSGTDLITVRIRSRLDTPTGAKAMDFGVPCLASYGRVPTTCASIE